jgi:hypothetical protein
LTCSCWRASSAFKFQLCEKEGHVKLDKTEAKYKTEYLGASN